MGVVATTRKLGRANGSGADAQWWLKKWWQRPPEKGGGSW